MKKFILVCSATIILICITMFYTYKEKHNDSKLDTVVLSEVTHSIFYSPLYVSIEKGYFKDEGIDIDLVLTPGADKVATSVISGDANIGFSGPEATIYVYNNSKMKLITFASLTKRDGQFIVGDCALKDKFNMNMLKGKKVLAGRTAGMPLMMFMYALKEANVDYNKVNIDSSVDFASLAGAYMSGQGDFVNLFEPNALKVEQSKSGCVLASLGNLSGEVPYTTFYAKEDYINNNKDLIKRFNKALNKGIRFVLNNNEKDIADAIINQFSDMNKDDLTLLVKRYKDADSWYDSTYIKIEDFNRLQDVLLYGKSINNKIDNTLLITNEFNK